MGMTPQHFHTIPTSCAILPPLTQICFVFICREGLWKACNNTYDCILHEATKSRFAISGPTSHLKMTRLPGFFYCFIFIVNAPQVERKRWLECRW